MPVFMTHPDNGATHVNSGEVEAHEKLGWKQDTYDNWMAPKRKMIADAARKSEVSKDDNIDLSKFGKEFGELTHLRAKYEDKFGKQPHHKKSVETLRKELE